MSDLQQHDSSAAPHPIHLCGQEIPHAGHICAFFDSRSQKYSVLAPYFAEGIAEGDRIINVVEAKEREHHIQALKQANVPITDAIDRGQFKLLTAEETYLKDGVVDLDGMLELLREALETAKREGTSIRTCGEMNWVARSQMSTEQVMSYEARVNDFVPTFQCTLVCVYDVAQLRDRPGIVADILATHPAAIMDGQLRSNPLFVDPEVFLGKLQERSAKKS